MVGIFFERLEPEEVLLETRHRGQAVGGCGEVPDPVEFYRHGERTPLIRTRCAPGTRPRAGAGYAKVKYFSYAPVTSLRCSQYCHMPPL